MGYLNNIEFHTKFISLIANQHAIFNWDVGFCSTWVTIQDITNPCKILQVLARWCKLMFKAEHKFGFEKSCTGLWSINKAQSWICTMWHDNDIDKRCWYFWYLCLSLLCITKHVFIWILACDQETSLIYYPWYFLFNDCPEDMSILWTP